MHTIIARSLKALEKNLYTVLNEKEMGLVPTMGCLHKGHLELIKKSKKMNKFTVVSIFINPIQFNNKSDLKRYPSKEKEDIKLLKKYEVDLIFIPRKEEIYPKNFSTYINDISHSNILCGKFRKNHFSGVLTVVLKLFLLIKPKCAFFGEKDYQQLFVIRKMVKDLNLDIKILSVPTVRDKYGLALSSRNRFLTKQNLAVARNIYKRLRNSLNRKFNNTQSLLRILKEDLYKIGVENIEYIEIRNSIDLKIPTKISAKSKIRLFYAVKLGRVRLIDNLKFK